jgi:hypothetical protein
LLFIDVKTQKLQHSGNINFKTNLIFFADTEGEWEIREGRGNGRRDVTPQAIWSVEKHFMKMDGSKAPTSINGHLGFQSNTLSEVNIIAVLLDNRFTRLTKNIKGAWRLDSKLRTKPSTTIFRKE